jgi:hypothetical protein
MKQFILWSTKDGNQPRFSPEGNIESAGVIGVVGEDNVYIAVYARYPKGSKAVAALEVNECIPNVLFSLSGTKGHYDLYRVS